MSRTNNSKNNTNNNNSNLMVATHNNDSDNDNDNNNNNGELQDYSFSKVAFALIKLADSTPREGHNVDSWTAHVLASINMKRPSRDADKDTLAAVVAESFKKVVAKLSVEEQGRRRFRLACEARLNGNALLEVAYKFSPEQFENIVELECADHWDQPAYSFLNNEYYRAERAMFANQKKVISSLAQTGRVQGVSETVLANAITVVAPTDDKLRHLSQSPGASQLLMFLLAYHRENMPLNSIAIRILSDKTVFSRGFKVHQLPYEVTTIIDAWVRHACNVRERRFADIMNVLSSKSSNFNDICEVRDKPGYNEIRAMALAFQLALQKTIENSQEDGCSITVDIYFKNLRDVDALATKIYSATSLSIHTGDSGLHGTPLQFPELHFHEVHDRFMSVACKQFFLELPQKKEAVNPASQDDKANNNAVGKVAVECNYCKVVTSDHKGANCPWRKSDMEASEVRKLSAAERIAGP